MSDYSEEAMKTALRAIRSGECGAFVIINGDYEAAAEPLAKIIYSVISSKDSLIAELTKERDKLKRRLENG